MAEKNINQEFKLENIDETRSYFVKEIEQNALMCKKHEKVYTTLNCIEKILLNFNCSYWMYSNFCFCFFTWFSYGYYELSNRI